MSSNKKKTILADKINTLLSAAPTKFNSDDEVDDTRAKVVEPHEESDVNSDDDFYQSQIRRQNVQLLDEIDKRYEGKKVSRKDLYTAGEDSDSIEDFKEKDAEEEEASVEEKLSDEIDNEELSGTEDSGEEEDDREQEFDTENPLYRERNKDFNFKTISTTNIQGEFEKGNCVRNQLKIWENLLEMRIRLQKCLVTSNQMPQHDVHKNFRIDGEFMKKTNEAKSKLMLLLNNMLHLQTTLLKQFSETKNLNTKNKNQKKKKNDNLEEDEKGSMNEEIPSDTEDEMENMDEAMDSKMGMEKGEEEEEEEEEEEVQRHGKKMKFAEYEKELQERHQVYSNYRDSVISKWNDKTRVASGNLNKSGNQTTLKQIEFALNDKSKLRKRTQLKRSDYMIIGKSLEDDNDERRTQEHDAEIYDDDDFYHQLLRDLIEHKSSDVTDPIQLSKQWIQLQNMRSKMKRKIDTRATKGRRVRYNVHTKLVNFMAPITIYDTWTDSAKNELYNSLFGKIKTVEGIDH